MRKSQYTEEQIIKALHEWDAGAKPGELSRRLGVTETPLYRWKRKFGWMQVNDAKLLRALEEENRQLKRLVADQALNLQVVKDLLGKKVVTAEHRRTAVTMAMEAAAIPERRACRYLGFARSSQRYWTRRAPRHELRERLRTLAILRPRWGYRRLHRLLRREGWTHNRKLTQRVYREGGLHVRRRRRKRVAVPRTPMATRRARTSAGAWPS